MRDLYLVIANSVLNHVAFLGSRVTVALYAISLGASPFTVGVLMALYAFLPMLLSVWLGRLTDRVGARAPMLAGTALLAASVLVPALWHDLAALYLASPLIGTGFMIYHVSAQHIVGFIGAPRNRQFNFSLFALGFSISGFLGPALAGAAIDAIGFAPTFALLSGAPLAPLALLAFNRVRLPAPHGPRERGAGERSLLDLLREEQLFQVFVASGLLSIAWDMFSFAMPIYGSRIGLSASAIGLILAAFAAATFSVRVALPALARRVAAWSLLVGSQLAAGAIYALFPFFQSTAPLAALAFALGLALGSSQPTVMSLLHLTAPPGRVGEAVGLRLTLVNLSQTTMPLLFGALGAAIGIAPVFWATALMLAWGGYSARRSGAPVE